MDLSGHLVQNDVISTSKRRNHIASNLIRRQFLRHVPAERLCIWGHVCVSLSFHTETNASDVSVILILYYYYSKGVSPKKNGYIFQEV